MPRISALLFCLLSSWALAHEEIFLAAGDSPPTIEDAPPPAEQLPEDDGSRVAILGYHEFSAVTDPTAMRIRTSTFETQMEALKTLNLPVISLEQFLLWKRGEANIPPRSVLITIDDGWKSVYTDAYPVLKKYGYPFTVYLYKNYVDGGGRALTTPMIKEMQQNGCTIGSHSVSHPFPSTVKSHAKKGPDDYNAFLRTELGESRRFLKDKFGEEVTTYAYAGGYYTDEMFAIGNEAGYELFLTVKPGKVRRDSPRHTIPRYIVRGVLDKQFESATQFQATGTAGSAIGYQTTPHPVFPKAGGMVESRLPDIWADLSAVENLDPAKLAMRVSGFGLVPATFDPATKKLRWPVTRRLRQEVTEVAVQWSLLEKSKPEPPMEWSFLIDREAAYQSGAGE
ncbi:MAG: polysaccharide deacetylase family protein [Verrucomicrobia bacterium]|nr:polysaccharide deacetylase family protein [Verrucomicrobiota bacterium]